MKINQYSAGDYAGLMVDDLEFYYGYEVTDEADPDLWCFVVKKDKKEIFRTNQQYIKGLECGSNLSEPVDYLLVGIAMWIAAQNPKL